MLPPARKTRQNYRDPNGIEKQFLNRTMPLLITMLIIMIPLIMKQQEEIPFKFPIILPLHRMPWGAAATAVLALCHGDPRPLDFPVFPCPISVGAVVVETIFRQQTIRHRNNNDCCRILQSDYLPITPCRNTFICLWWMCIRCFGPYPSLRKLFWSWFCFGWPGSCYKGTKCGNSMASRLPLLLESGKQECTRKYRD